MRAGQSEDPVYGVPPGRHERVERKTSTTATGGQMSENMQRYRKLQRILTDVERLIGRDSITAKEVRLAMGATWLDLTAEEQQLVNEEPK